MGKGWDRDWDRDGIGIGIRIGVWGGPPERPEMAIARVAGDGDRPLDPNIWKSGKLSNKGPHGTPWVLKCAELRWEQLWFSPQKLTFQNFGYFF